VAAEGIAPPVEVDAQRNPNGEFDAVALDRIRTAWIAESPPTIASNATFAIGPEGKDGGQ
jgi:hypothetical protein